MNTTTLSFGNHVNEKLLTYSDFVRNQVEYKISTILYEADMGYYDRPVRRIGSSNSSSYPYSPQAELIPSPLPSPHAESNKSCITHTVGKPDYSSHSSFARDTSAPSPQSSTLTVRDNNKDYQILVSTAVQNTTDNNLTEIGYDTTDIYSEPF